MIFKNMTFFKTSFTDDKAPSQPEIEEALQQIAFRRCLPSLLSSSGFFHPMAPLSSIPDKISEEDEENGVEVAEEGDNAITHSIPQAVMFSVMTETKDIKKSELELRKVSRVKKQLGAEYKHTDPLVIKQMMLDCEEEIVAEMAKNAFSSFNKVDAIFDFKTDHLIISSTSNSVIENVKSLLSRVFNGNIHFVPAKPFVDLKRVMTLWIDDRTDNEPPNGFILGGDCVLIEDGNKKSKVTCANQNLSSDEIINHVADYNKVVTKVSLNFDDKFFLTLDEEFSFTKVSAGSKFLDEKDDADVESLAELRDAEFSITMNYLREALETFYEYFREMEESEGAS